MKPDIAKAAPVTIAAPDLKPAPKTYPVKVIKFGLPQDGPGFSVQSSLTVRCKTNPTGKHSAEYMPALRSFRVTYTPPDGDPVTAFIPEYRVTCWYPLD